MLFYSKRSCALPTLKNALHLQKQRKTCEMIPLARTTVSTWVATVRWRLRSVKSNHEWQTRSLWSRFFFFFFFFFFLHAYMTSDLRTFRRTCVHVCKECSLEISVHQSGPSCGLTWYFHSQVALWWRLDIRPFAQLLSGLETAHPAAASPSPAYDFSVFDEQKAVFLVS